ncbi:MAG: DUF6033 family protein [Lachnospiraceae bacterium]|nr:DUF6033 family protein [Lachnospiraceae bacterium]
MAGLFGVSAYQQMNASWKAESKKTEERKQVSAAQKNTEAARASKTNGEAKTPEVEYKKWSPIDTKSSLVPQVTEYGSTIGEVELSDAAKKYYEQLKNKFNTNSFILVSNDMMDAVKQNAAAYGSSSGLVVLIDAEKIEKMATDEAYRKKYEGIIATAQMKLADFANSLSSTGAPVTNFGMSVDKDGNTSFFATVEKSQKQQMDRIEAKREAKREQKAKEAKEENKERIEARRAERREEARRMEEKLTEGKDVAEGEEALETEETAKEYYIIEGTSWDDLLDKVTAYSYDMAARSVMTEGERSLGRNIDFKG